MPAGYIYILSNPAMPGLLKIGRTDRRPDLRASELSTTGVPARFVVEFSILVHDSVAAERAIHLLLEGRGCRHSQDREFFAVGLDDAISVARSISTSLYEQTSESEILELQFDLSELFTAVNLPVHGSSITQQAAQALESQLLPIAARGFSYAYKALGDVFSENWPSSIKFKQYWLDYLDSAFRDARYSPTGRYLAARQAVGTSAAEYLSRNYERGWLGGPDFDFLQRFLMSSDGYVYEGFVGTVKRPEFPNEVRERALNL